MYGETTLSAYVIIAAIIVVVYFIIILVMLGSVQKYAKQIASLLEKKDSPAAGSLPAPASEEDRKKFAQCFQWEKKEDGAFYLVCKEYNLYTVGNVSYLPVAVRKGEAVPVIVFVNDRPVEITAPADGIYSFKKLYCTDGEIRLAQGEEIVKIDPSKEAVDNYSNVLHLQAAAVKAEQESKFNYERMSIARKLIAEQRYKEMEDEVRKELQELGEIKK